LKTVKPSEPLKGTITVPADKSITHRAIIFSSLAEGDSVIRNPLRAEDPMSTLAAFRLMGVSARDGEGGEIIINGNGLRGLAEPSDVIDCGNSGTTARLLCGVLAAQPFFSVLTGDASLRRRPMSRVTGPLSEMGARFFGRDNGKLLPIAVRGGLLKPIRFVSPVASAQIKTAILLAGLFCDGVTEVVEPERSRDHTERMLPAYGANLEVDGLAVRIAGGARLSGMDMTVPGDISSAAFFIVAALIVPGSEVLVENVGMNPTRTGMIDILLEMGADIRIQNERAVSGEPVADILARHSELKAITIGGSVIPRAIDEFPSICVAAAFADGKTVIRDAAELRVKESDRIRAMAECLGAMGVPVEELPDGMAITGVKTLSPGAFDSRGDHRIAMSMAIAGLRANGESRIEGDECIATSFPDFWDCLRRLQGGGT
jgi:3-phosphoshikimate 1-carboxyvinyltransferase